MRLLEYNNGKYYIVDNTINSEYDRKIHGKFNTYSIYPNFNIESNYNYLELYTNFKIITVVKVKNHFIYFSKQYTFNIINTIIMNEMFLDFNKSVEIFKSTVNVKEMVKQISRDNLNSTLTDSFEIFNKLKNNNLPNNEYVEMFDDKYFSKN